ncbi:hypothetical protein AB0O34_35705, partial [Sphaerisporangium sp. NPDC088356]|uniref:hypothetical protein n=1 Tax=Sphaerisporangium sp. NPDC088356 TaxID=3154871 RepID=UPI00341AB1E1
MLRHPTGAVPAPGRRSGRGAAALRRVSLAAVALATAAAPPAAAPRVTAAPAPAAAFKVRGFCNTAAVRQHSNPPGIQ